MEIRVYDRDLKRVGQIENQTSLIWTRKFYEPGTFEIHAPATDKNIALLEKQRLVSYAGAREAGVIENLEKEDSDIKDEITATGRFLSSYMDRRLIKQTFTFSGKAEEAIFGLYDYCVPIPHVEKADLKGFDDRIEFQATMKELLLYQTKLSKATNIGFRFRPDFRTRRIIFETYKGTDHSIEQNKVKRVTFSENYNNLKNAIYKYNDQQLKTKAIVGGEGEGAARVYVEVGGGEGYDLREIFVDARDLQRGDMAEDQYKALLRQRGVDTLNSQIAAESLESEVEPSINFKYKEDYDLGDIVTVRKKKWNLYMNQRITEIAEVYEYGVGYVVPVFGSALPEKIDWRDD